MRTVLVVAVVALVVLAGCSFGNLTSREGRHDMEVRNNDDTSHEVTILVVKESGATVQRQTQTLGQGQTWNAGSISAAGKYDVTVTVDGGEMTYRDSLDLPIASEGNESVSVVRIGRDGNVTGEIQVRSTGNQALAPVPGVVVARA
jgi:hypothetical protein